MENSFNLYEGKYGVRESLLALKKKEEDKLTVLVNALETSISSQLAERDALAMERDAKKDQLEREYTIRINNNNKDLERIKNTIAELEKEQDNLKQELAACSFVAVGKKKTLTEKIADNDEQLAKLANNLRVTETTGEELISGKEKNINKLDFGLNRLKESMKDVTDKIDEYNDSIAELKKAQAEYKELSDFDLHRRLTDDSVLKDYVLYLLLDAHKELTFSEIQHRNVIFALITDDRLNNVLKELADAERINKTMVGDTAYFSAND